MNLDIVLLDIDGCVTEETFSPYSDDISVLRQQFYNHKYNEYWPEIIFCTGRPQPYTEALMRYFDVNIAICEGGAMIYKRGDNPEFVDITNIQIKEISTLRYLLLKYVLPRFDGLAYLPGKDCQISLYFAGCTTPVSEIIQYINRYTKDKFDVSTTKHTININIKGMSKANAIKRLYELRGITGDDVLGIGDTIGDMAIRENCRVFACPSNAIPKIQEVSDYVSKLPITMGVYDIFSHYFLNKTKSNKEVIQ